MRFLVFFLFLFMNFAQAGTSIVELDAKDTRFVCTRANKVNSRSGPNLRYPIEWVYQQKNHPLEIVAEYDLWRKVRDSEGAESWVRKNLLANQRFALITKVGRNNVYQQDSLSSDVIAKVENGVVGKIEKCTATFCLLKFEDKIEGWVERNIIFGVKKGEIL